LTNSCFEARQLWGVALESNFGQPLSETTFGGKFSSCSEQLSISSLGNGFWGTTLWSGAALGSRSSFEEQLCTAALTGKHLWRIALERNFGEQLSAATLGSNFREPLWRIALGSALGNRFKA